MPTLLIHGKDDTLVPSSHSLELYGELMRQKLDKTKTDYQLRHLELSQLLIHDEVGHNDFNMFFHILIPMKIFI